MIRIRALSADEGALLKRLRLAALKESPDAFSPLYADFAGRDDDYWQSAATRIAAATGFEMFVAEVDGVASGLVSGNRDESGTGHVGAMWCSPDVRRRGVGAKLVEHVLTYLEQQACEQVMLTVTENNTSAISLYKSHGFEMTGNHEPLREGSTLRNLEMIATNPAS